MRRLFFTVIMCFSALTVFCAEQFDIAIINGTVIDPETSTQAKLNVGVTGGSIATVTPFAISGRKTIDAKDLIVSPGFIDFMSYDLNGVGDEYKVFDGVTTNLSMHGSWITDFKRYFVHYGQMGAVMNYGAAVNLLSLRNEVGCDEQKQTMTDKQAEAAEKTALLALEDGALGICLSLEYQPGITEGEALRFFKVCAKGNGIATVHARYSTMFDENTNFDAINEVIRLTKKSGASSQVLHINSTGGTFSMKRSLEMLSSARALGYDVGADIYTYNSWATYLKSARFDGNWQQRFNLTYSDLQVAGTGELLSKEKFAKYRKENKLVAAYAIPENDIEEALECPWVFVASDTLLQKKKDANNHPRGAGCFSRLFKVYVRERKVLSLMDAVSKCTYLPAKRLEKFSSVMKRKGRIQAGADADITVFNADKIEDKATIEEPAQFSEGIRYVLVNGVVVKDRNGMVKLDRLPGHPVKRDIPAVKK